MVSGGPSPTAPPPPGGHGQSLAASALQYRVHAQKHVYLALHTIGLLIARRSSHHCNQTCDLPSPWAAGVMVYSLLGRGEGGKGTWLREGRPLVQCSQATSRDGLLSVAGSGPPDRLCPRHPREDRLRLSVPRSTDEGFVSNIAGPTPSPAVARWLRVHPVPKRSLERRLPMRFLLRPPLLSRCRELKSWKNG